MLKSFRLNKSKDGSEQVNEINIEYISKTIFITINNNNLAIDKRIKILKMPSLSPTMENGSLKKVSIKEGDKFSPGTLFAEVETDKSVIDWESTESGFIAKLFAKVDTPIPVGAPVALVVKSKDHIELAKSVSESDLQEDSQKDKSDSKDEKPKKESLVPNQEQSLNETIYESNTAKMSPAARLKAKEIGIDSSVLLYSK